MPQEFHVLRCFSCSTYQVHFVKKINKWQCKICNEKQSVKMVYGRGTGKDCRLHVQKLNMLQITSVGQQIESYEQIVNTSPHTNGDENEDFCEHPELKNSEQDQIEEHSASSKWSRFIEPKQQCPISDDEDDFTSGRLVKRKKIIDPRQESPIQCESQNFGCTSQDNKQKPQSKHINRSHNTLNNFNETRVECPLLEENKKTFSVPDNIVPSTHQTDQCSKWGKYVSNKDSLATESSDLTHSSLKSNSDSTSGSSAVVSALQPPFSMGHNSSRNWKPKLQPKSCIGNNANNKTLTKLPEDKGNYCRNNLIDDITDDDLDQLLQF